MKASFFRRYGGPEVLEYGEVPGPVIRGNQRLMHASACSAHRRTLVGVSELRGHRLEIAVRPPHRHRGRRVTRDGGLVVVVHPQIEGIPIGSRLREVWRARSARLAGQNVRDRSWVWPAPGTVNPVLRRAA